jgi:hypothetical protein
MFLGWLEHPVTKDLRRFLKVKRVGLLELWASGAFAASFEAEYIARHSLASGTASAYKEILELTYEELSQGLEDDE